MISNILSFYSSTHLPISLDVTKFVAFIGEIDTQPVEGEERERESKKKVGPLFPTTCLHLPFIMYQSIEMTFIYLQEKETRGQQKRRNDKGKKKGDPTDEDVGPQELLKRPKEYVVKFTLPNPPSLSPPILGIYGEFPKPQSTDTYI